MGEGKWRASGGWRGVGEGSTTAVPAEASNERNENCTCQGPGRMHGRSRVLATYFCFSWTLHHYICTLQGGHRFISINFQPGRAFALALAPPPRGSV